LSLTERVRSTPTRDVAAARARFDALAARDDTSISHAGRSRLFDHAAVTPLAVVLIHGLTNAPEQWVPFARTLHARGHSVIIPRLPGHGRADRKPSALARVATEAYLQTTNDAIDIACGAGAAVIVAGLSIGGAFAAWHVLHRSDVRRALAIVPLFGFRKFPLVADRALATLLEFGPNIAVPWDPGGDGSQCPTYGYPRFATRALGRTLRIGLAVEHDARRLAPQGELVVALNAREPACENTVAEAIVARVARRNARAARTVVWPDLPAIHDIIDPTNPLGRTDLVYPRLTAEIER